MTQLGHLDIRSIRSFSLSLLNTNLTFIFFLAGFVLLAFPKLPFDDMMPQRKRNVRTTTNTTNSNSNNNNKSEIMATMNPPSSSSLSFDVEQQQQHTGRRPYRTSQNNSGNGGVISSFFFSLRSSSPSYRYQNYSYSMISTAGFFCCGLVIVLFVFLSSDSRRNDNSSYSSSVSSISSSSSLSEQQQYRKPFRLWSTAFEDGKTIPMKYARDGQNLSPPLFWEGGFGGLKQQQQHPPSSKEEVSSFVLIVDDPDAPTTHPWVHWILYNIPPTLHSLPEGMSLGLGSQGYNPTMMMKQGQNSWKLSQYDGPQPPEGQKHLYIFTIYALDTTIIDDDDFKKGEGGTRADAGMTKDKLLNAMEGHILEEAKWTGRFQSKSE